MRLYTGENIPLDFHEGCSPSEWLAKKLYGEGEGPDDRGNCFAYDAEHPDYESDKYLCEECGKIIADNYA